MRMITRRTVLAGLGAAFAHRGLRNAECGELDNDSAVRNPVVRNPQPAIRNATTSFHLSILTDEISQDFGRACEVAAGEFGMGLVDLREAGGKNLMNWDAA